MTLNKKEIGEGYDAIAGRVGLSEKFYGASIKMAGRLSGMVLDLGCGRGFLLNKVKKKFPYISIFGLDLSWVLVGETKKRNPKGKVFQGDVEFLPLRDCSFEFVFLTEVLEHLLDFQKGLTEIHRILKPNGKLLVTVPNRDWVCYERYMKNRTPFQPVDDHWFTKKELEGLLFSAGFEIEKIGGGETLRQSSGFTRILERFEMLLDSSLSQKMKRLMILSRKP